MQSFYYEGKAIMSNEEFDNLKEELMWEGSSVVMLSTVQLLAKPLNRFLLDKNTCIYLTRLLCFERILSPAASDEQRFLEASMAYVSGNPIVSDKEFDELKLKLKVCKRFDPVCPSRS